jgi:hypothetical protein
MAHNRPADCASPHPAQVACQGDLRVVKRSGFWGQGADILTDLPAGSEQAAAAEVQPLGQLEFVLDRRRRER